MIIHGLLRIHCCKKVSYLEKNVQRRWFLSDWILSAASFSRKRQNVMGFQGFTHTHKHFFHWLTRMTSAYFNLRHYQILTIMHKPNLFDFSVLFLHVCDLAWSLFSYYGTKNGSTYEQTIATCPEVVLHPAIIAPLRLITSAQKIITICSAR